MHNRFDTTYNVGHVDRKLTHLTDVGHLRGNSWVMRLKGGSNKAYVRKHHVCLLCAAVFPLSISGDLIGICGSIRICLLLLNGSY